MNIRNNPASLDNHVEKIFSVIQDATVAMTAMVEVCSGSEGARQERDHWLNEAKAFLVELPAIFGQEYLHCLHLTVLDAGKAMGRIVESCMEQKRSLVFIWVTWLRNAESVMSAAINSFQALFQAEA